MSDPAASPVQPVRVGRPFYAPFGDWLKPRSPKMYRALQLSRRAAADVWRHRGWTGLPLLVALSLMVLAVVPPLAAYALQLLFLAGFIVLAMALAHVTYRLYVLIDAAAEASAAAQAHVAETDRRIALHERQLDELGARAAEAAASSAGAVATGRGLHDELARAAERTTDQGRTLQARMERLTADLVVMQSDVIALDPRRARKADVWHVRLSKGKTLTMFPDDLMIASYPRSGNTWVRFLISTLRSDQPTTFDNYDERIPDVYRFTDTQLRRVSRPRTLKTHEPYHPLYRRVIYLVRDPREIAPSYMRYLKMRGLLPEQMDFDEFLPLFVEGQVGRFGSWEEHVNDWLTARGDDEDFLLVSYENLLNRTTSEVGRIARFIGVSDDAQALARAIDLSGRDRMSALADELRSRGQTVEPGARVDIPFIGRADDKQSMATALIDERWAATLRRLGYSAPDTS